MGRGSTLSAPIVIGLLVLGTWFLFAFEKPSRAALVLLAFPLIRVAVPFIDQLSITGLNSQNLALYSLALAVGLRCYGRRQFHFPRHGAVSAVLWFFGHAALWAFWLPGFMSARPLLGGGSSPGAIITSKSMMDWIVLAFIMLQIVVDEKWMRQGVKLFLLVATVFSLLSLYTYYQFAQVYGIAWLGGARIYSQGTGAWIDNLPVISMLGLMLVIALQIDTQRLFKLPRLLAICLGLLFLSMILLSYQRNIYVATVFALLALAWQRGRWRGVGLALAASLAIVPLLPSQVHGRVLATFGQPAVVGQAAGLSERLFFWRVALSAILDPERLVWLTGVGTDRLIEHTGFGAISAYLEVWGGQGLPGLVLLIILLATFLRTSLNWYRSLPGIFRPISLALFATGIGVTIMMVADNRFLVSWFYFYYILFMAVLNRSVRQDVPVTLPLPPQHGAAATAPCPSMTSHAVHHT